MTIRQFLEEQLVANGLWPNEATEVMDLVVAGNEPMQGRWNEDKTAYPSQLLTVLFLSAKAVAIKWIDENKPQHFARMILSA